MSFLGKVRKRALQAYSRIVLPEATDERVLRATAEILKEKLARPVLIGNPEKNSFRR